MTNFDKYRGTVEYPTRPSKPTLDVRNATPDKALKFAEELKQYEIDRAGWDKKVNLWRQDQRNMEALFKDDVIRENDLLGHPKADKIFAFAWEHGDKDLRQVCDLMAELAELVEKGPKLY